MMFLFLVFNIIKSGYTLDEMRELLVPVVSSWGGVRLGPLGTSATNWPIA
jgi:hypothetical protein